MISNPITSIVNMLIPLVFTTTPPENSIEWNQRKLTFEDFVAQPKESNQKVKGEFTSNISWRFNYKTNQPPTFSIYNKMIPEQSWMSVKHPELLKEYQFLWDVQELYARKTRKIVHELNENKNMDVNLYREKIYQQVKILQKEQNKYRGTIINQPDFYKILNKQYQDSLNLYAKYEFIK